MAGDAVIEVKDVRVTFGGVAALDGLNVHVDRGESVAVLGPNGSGKTTMLNAITGFVPVRSGQVRLFGNDVTTLPTHKRVRLGVGRSFQNLRVVRRVSVAELLQFGWHQRDPRNFLTCAFRPFWMRRSERAARLEAAAALKLVGLSPEILDTRIASLSQGQLKLVDIARTLMPRPKVLLLDEPTSGLSRGDVGQMADLMHSLRDEGITLLVVEHDVRFVLSWADRVVVMASGGVLAEGDPHATMALPQVVDAYLGTGSGATADEKSAPSGVSIGKAGE